jgi:hypothetical protein
MTLTNEHIDAVEAKLRQGWSRRAMARAANNWRVAPDSPKAVRWCPAGAAEACGCRDVLTNAWRRRFGQCDDGSFGSMSQFNDRVAKSVDDVISKLEELRP